MNNSILTRRKSYKMIISSRVNPKYKHLLQLSSSHGRKRQSEFLIEGFRELTRAISAGVQIEYAVFSQTFFQQSKAREALVSLLNQDATIVLPDSLFARLSQREHPDGVLGVAKKWDCDFSQLRLQSNGLYLLVEGVEKPGNLGALMRSAEATGVDGIFIANPVVDVFNPNVIRTSQGAVFNLPIYWESSEYLLRLLKASSLHLFATTPHAQQAYWDCDLKSGCVICIGSEAYGLTQPWLQEAVPMLIPMYGNSADSLNAGVSATLCLYEARRQRRA